MVNTNMFRHPKYYKELRKRNKSDQVISERATETSTSKRAPGPGLKVLNLRIKQQASGNKPQATSNKRSLE
jgi:hypothetical protein